MDAVWTWLQEKDHRDLLTMAGAGVATLVAAVWAVFTFVRRSDKTAPSVTATDGVAAGRDMSGNTINISGDTPAASGSGEAERKA